VKVQEPPLLDLINSVANSSFSPERMLKVLEVMHLTRFIDEKMSKLVRQNKGGTFHLSALGHEMIGAISALSLIPGTDWAFPYYRDRAFAIGLGCKPLDILAALLARDIPSHSVRRMMPEHFSEESLRITYQSSVVGSQFLQAVEVAKSVQLRKVREVVYVSGGDGSTSQGDFPEALNFSCLHQLPIVFVVQDNSREISVPVVDRIAGGSIAKMARGYEGLSVFEIDGCDYLETTSALTAAVETARSGKGPSLVVAKIPRIGAHSSSDDPKKYKTETHLEEGLQEDPLARFETALVEGGMISQEELEAFRRKHSEQIEEAALAADQIPFPKRETAAEKVYAPFKGLHHL
jgi:2-oxoisovalerate dehydrogenase E1 component